MSNKAIAPNLPSDVLYDKVCDMANCKDSEPSIFFYEEGMKGIRKRLQLVSARAVCGPCVVRNECLEFALQTGQEFGVWGGLDERERKKLMNQKKLEHKSIGVFK